MLDVRFFHSPKIAALPNRAKLGWISLLCEAKQQDREGVFVNRPVLSLAAGVFKDCIPAWLEAGLLHYAPALCPRCDSTFRDVPLDGAVVHDWYDYQEESRWTKWRRTKDAPTDAPDAAPSAATPSAPSVHHRTLRAGASVSVSSSSSSVAEGGSGETADPADAYWSLTGRYPTDKLLSWIDDLTSKYGAEPTVRAVTQAHIADPKTATLLGRAQDILRAEARALDRKEQEAERERLREKRAIPKVVPAWEQEFRKALEAKYGVAG